MQGQRVGLPVGGAVLSKDVGQLQGWRGHQRLVGLRLADLVLPGWSSRSRGEAVLPIVAGETEKGLLRFAAKNVEVQPGAERREMEQTFFSLIRLERLSGRTAAEGDDRLCRGVHPPVSAARSSTRLATHPLLRLSGQLPSCRKARSMPPSAGRWVRRPASAACRLPRFFGGAYCQQLQTVPALWHWNFDLNPDPVAVSWFRFFSRRQLMMPTGGNSQLPRRCLPGRAHSHCVQRRSGTTAALIRTMSFFPHPLHSGIRTSLGPPMHRRTNDQNPCHTSASTPIPHPTAEQNPLKTGQDRPSSCGLIHCGVSSLSRR